MLDADRGGVLPTAKTPERLTERGHACIELILRDEIGCL